MGNGIRAGILRALLAGDAMSRPRDYTKGVLANCDCAARCRALGTSVQELVDNGFALQCVTHAAMQGNGSKASKEDLEFYKREHIRNFATNVTGNSCPSGLRPARIPNAASTPDVTSWTASLRDRLYDPINKVADDAIIECPAVPVTKAASIVADDNGNLTGRDREREAHKRGASGIASGAPRTVRVPAPFRDFVVAREACGAAIITMLGALERAEVPQNDTREALCAWSLSMPTERLFGVQATDFDATMIRAGSLVRFKDTPEGSQALRRMGGSIPSDGIVVVKFNDDGSVVVRGPKRELTVPKGSIERIPPPEPPKPVTPPAWAPKVGFPAIYTPVSVVGQEPMTVEVIGSKDGKFIVEFELDGEFMELGVTPSELTELPTAAS